MSAGLLPMPDAAGVLRHELRWCARHPQAAEVAAFRNVEYDVMIALVSFTVPVPFLFGPYY